MIIVAAFFSCVNLHAQSEVTVPQSELTPEQQKAREAQLKEAEQEKEKAEKFQKEQEKQPILYEFTYGIHMIGREKLIPLNDNFIYIMKYGKRE
jgi:histidinol dehydrogenase